MPRGSKWRLRTAPEKRDTDTMLDFTSRVPSLAPEPGGGREAQRHSRVAFGQRNGCQPGMEVFEQPPGHAIANAHVRRGGERNFHRPAEHERGDARPDATGGAGNPALP